MSYQRHLRSSHAAKPLNLQPEKSDLQLLHQDMRTFVNEVLRTIPREPRRTIIDRVFLGIERNPAWLKHYNQLKTQHGIAVIRLIVILVAIFVR